MHNATAYNHAYGDSGVFCIHAAAHPTQLRELVEVLTREFVSMAGVIQDSELNVSVAIKRTLTCLILIDFYSESENSIGVDVAHES